MGFPLDMVLISPAIFSICALSGMKHPFTKIEYELWGLAPDLCRHDDLPTQHHTTGGMGRCLSPVCISFLLTSS